MLTLKEISKLMENTEDALEHINDVVEFSSRIDDVATNIFKNRDKEYGQNMLAMAQALALSVMLSRGTISVEDVMAFIGSRMFREYTLIVIKMVVGLSAMEELR